MVATAQTAPELSVLPSLRNLFPRWREFPLYHGRWLPGDSASAQHDFFRLPFITKRDISDGFPRNFLRPGQSLEDLLDGELVELEHTSGTSDERMPVLLGRGWWEAQEERALRLNRFVARVLDEVPLARRAVLTTPVCNGTACHSRWTPRSGRTIGRSRFINQARIPFLLQDDELARMADEAADWAPEFLDTDPVHATWFARYCERKGIRLPSLRFILCSYEFVSTMHCRLLERVFGVPVFNLYGSTETGHLLMEDELGSMRPSAATAFLETVDPDPQGIGHLVVTTLTNDYMPLVRYRIGDLVEPVRRGGDPAYVVHGRARDALRDGAGRRITTWQVDRCFADVDGLAHYELRQSADGRCRLRYVPDQEGPSALALAGLKGRLESLLQLRFPIATEAVEALVPAPSGKFRLTCRE